MQRKQIIIRTILIIGIIVFINIIAIRVFTRFDLTSSKMYTLSDASKNLVKSLDDKFVVKAYFTSDLPAPYNGNRRFLQDQLDEYRAYAGGNFQYEFIDPSKKEEIEQEAQRYQIPDVRVQVVKSDKAEVVKAYMGVVFLYGDKQERLPVIQSTSNLEYEISSAIKKLTTKTLKKIGILSGHGEAGLDQLKKLKDVLDKQYEIETVDLAGGKAIPQNIAALLIAGPQQPYKSWEKFLIDQYIMKGGKVAFMLNKVSATIQTQMGRALNLDLDDMLETYGVRINTDLVRDVRCAPVTISQPTGFFMMTSQIPFYYLPIASEFSKTSPIVKDLGGVVFYFVSSIDTSLARTKGLHLEVLAKTSNRSGRQEQFFLINPNAQVTEDMFKESGIPLAVTVEGKFTSAFSNKPITLDSATAMLDTTHKITSGISSKIAVVGDGDFVQEQYSGGVRDNIVFTSNLVDWLADDIGLASIRSRESGPKPLDEVSEGTRSMVKGLNLALPPLLVVLVGVARWRWRIAMRRRLESKGF